MSIEAMKQWLEALEMVKANADEWQERTGKEIKGWMKPVNESVTSLRQAIAEAEKQEPVALDTVLRRAIVRSGKVIHPQPAQPKREPLTYEQVDTVIEQTEIAIGHAHNAWDMVDQRELVRAVLKAAHGIGKGEA